MADHADESSESKLLIFSNATYDRLKWVAQILLPAVATLVFALGQVWDIPNVTQIVGTITALDVFLGVILGLSSNAYNKSDAKYDGTMTVDASGENKDLYKLVVNTPLEDLPGKDEITFKVKPADEGTEQKLF